MAYALLGGLMLSACSAEEFSGANGELPSAAEFADNFKIDVDQETNTANFSFEGAEGVTPVWVIDGAYSSDFSLSKYYRKKGTYDVECFVKNRNGISKESIKKQFNIEKTKMNGFAGFVEDSEFNLFKNITLPEKPTSYYYAPGWSQIADPTCSFSKGCYTLNFPEATSDQWQAQVHFDNLGISLSADKHYDYSMILTSAKGHKNVTLKLQETGNDDKYIVLREHLNFEAGEPKCVFGSDIEGVDISNLKMVFDFGGNQAGDEIMIESFVLKDHANDDGTEVPEELNVPFDYNTAGNLWKEVDANKSFTEETWYGDADWGTIDVTPVIKHEGNKHTIVVPCETPNQQWHAQWKLRNIPIEIGKDAKIDFSCKVTSSAKLPQMTIKICDYANDGNLFFMDVPTNIKGEYVCRYENQPNITEKKEDGTGGPADMKTIDLVFDLAGAPVGTEVTISDIVLVVK